MSKAIRIRRLAGVPRYRVASDTGLSDNLVRLYEANADAVTPPVRARLDLYYRELATNRAEQLTELLRTDTLRLVPVQGGRLT